MSTIPEYNTILLNAIYVSSKHNPYYAKPVIIEVSTQKELFHVYFLAIKHAKLHRESYDYWEDSALDTKTGKYVTKSFEIWGYSDKPEPDNYLWKIQIVLKETTDVGFEINACNDSWNAINEDVRCDMCRESYDIGFRNGLKVGKKE
jgi:hypothetical protein